MKLADLDPGRQAELSNRPPSTLDGIGFTFYADLYRAFRGVMSPAEIDECQLWQLGALLGLDRKEPAAPDPLERLAAQVEPGNGPVDMTAQIMREMGIQTA